jgi:hypothetical protein
VRRELTYDPAVYEAEQQFKLFSTIFRLAGNCCTTTIFTWGYYGWGNATPQLVESVDAVETSRGFEPPIFVDIRIRRNVRAKGFVGKGAISPHREFSGKMKHHQEDLVD